MPVLLLLPDRPLPPACRAICCWSVACSRLPPAALSVLATRLARRCQNKMHARRQFAAARNLFAQPVCRDVDVSAVTDSAAALHTTCFSPQFCRCRGRLNKAKQLQESAPAEARSAWFDAGYNLLGLALHGQPSPHFPQPVAAGAAKAGHPCRVRCSGVAPLHCTGVSLSLHVMHSVQCFSGCVRSADALAFTARICLASGAARQGAGRRHAQSGAGAPLVGVVCRPRAAAGGRPRAGSAAVHGAGPLFTGALCPLGLLDHLLKHVVRHAQQP